MLNHVLKLTAFISSLFALFVLSCSTKHLETNSAQTIIEPVPVDSTEITHKLKPKGVWFSAGYTVDYAAMGLYMDVDREFIQSPLHLYFEGDSVWIMEYPCRLISSQVYNSKQWILYNNVLKDLGDRTYMQVDFDTTLIKQVIKDRLIPTCYSGEWHLISSESGGDGTGADYIFPFDVADTLLINAADWQQDKINDGIIELNIGGELRPFYFYLNSKFNKHLNLRPTESWDNQDSRMWYAWWRDEEWSDAQIKALKEESGSELEIRYVKSTF